MVADAPGETAGIDAGDADQVAVLQPGVEMRGGAEIGRLRDVGGKDQATGGGARRLDILRIGPDIADMREGEGDDLAGKGGVGQALLIAGHRGVEAHLADRLAGGADAATVEPRAVGQNQDRGRACGRRRRRRRFRLRHESPGIYAGT
jgi:hypothetical protein